MSSDYFYLGTKVLVNLADIRDQDMLHHFERGRTALRKIELDINPIKGNFDLMHLKLIHKHLFQDVYPFAGQLRTVNIRKNNFPFCNHEEFGRHAEYVFGQLKQDKYLKNLGPESFAKKAAYYYHETNFGHYFREGNGRAIRTFFEHLSKNAGYELDWSVVPKTEYLEAVKETDDPNKLDSLVNVFRRIMSKDGEKEQALHSDGLQSEIKNNPVKKESWIEPKAETTLKDVLKDTEGLPAIDNPIEMNANILNTPVSKYLLTFVNGCETLRVQLKGQETIQEIRLEKNIYLSKKTKK